MDGTLRRFPAPGGADRDKPGRWRCPRHHVGAHGRCAPVHARPQCRVPEYRCRSREDPARRLGSFGSNATRRACLLFPRRAGAGVGHQVESRWATCARNTCAAAIPGRCAESDGRKPERDDEKPIDLSVPDPRVRRLTYVGADFSGWSDDGNSITWALGSTYFRRPLSSVVQRAAATAGRESGKRLDRVIPGTR